MSVNMTSKVDSLGCVTLPRVILQAMDLNESDSIEFALKGRIACFGKRRETCIFCNSIKDIEMYKGKPVCPHCMEGWKK